MDVRYIIQLKYLLHHLKNAKLNGHLYCHVSKTQNLKAANILGFAVFLKNLKQPLMA
jgi:hypothetical protein